MKKYKFKFVSFPFIGNNGLYWNLVNNYNNSYYNKVRFYCSSNNNDNLLDNQVNLNINSKYYSKNNLIYLFNFKKIMFHFINIILIHLFKTNDYFFINI